MKKNSESLTASTSHLSAAKRVFIIDQELPIADLVRRSCETMGYEAAIWRGNKPVIDEILAFEPDLVLIDVFSSNGVSAPSSLRCAQALKADPRTRHIQLLSLVQPDTLESKEFSNLSDVLLPKPLPFSVLASELKSLL